MNVPIPDIDYVRASEFGANWRTQFNDANGTPLSMLAFEQIDFGAISYKEVFQNCKTILSTPLLSVVLERTLGVDWDIVDLPIGKASEATVAIMDALYFWEPRAEIMDIEFDADINGRLTPNIQLKVKNVVFGTETVYSKTSIAPPPDLAPVLPPPPKPPTIDGDVVVIEGPPGETGPAGPQGATGPRGTRGSLWFTGATDPSAATAGVQAQDMYLNTTTAAIFQYDGTTWRKIFNGVDT